MKSDKTKILRLLKTAKGQLDGLIKMVEEDRDCIEISNQLLASQSILKKINLEILKDHFSHCIVEAIKEGRGVDEKMAEITIILDKLMK